VIATIGSFRLNAAQLVSIALVLFLTWVNSRGINGGKWIQTSFTLAKIAAVVALVACGLLLGARAESWQANWSMPALPVAVDGGIGSLGIPLVAAIAVSMVGSLFSADAWNSATFIAGEIRDPRRNVGRSLLLGTGIVCTLYVLMNLMYLAVLPLDGIAHAEADRVGVVAAQAIFGNAGTTVIAVLIMVSTFGCINGLVLSGARVYYTMAQDGLFFRQAGTLNRNAVPGWGLWIQGAWASLLCLSGRYGDLLDYVVFVVLVFYVLTMAGIFVLRRTRPDAERPYRAIGYPLLPALYIGLALTICGYLLAYKPDYTWPGLGIVALGIPIYFLIQRRAPALG
ncbi:MAG: APC family permease, partial [Xanthomonadales bacterium]|nr:APC family permease [Xanthomonadales bacterium]